MDKIVYRRLVNNASEEIRRWIDSGFLVNGRDWIESWFKHDLKWSDTNPSFITVPASELAPLCRTVQDSEQVLMLALFIASTRVNASTPIPGPLRELTVKYLKGELMPPRKPKGRPPAWGRDFIIIRAIYITLQDEERYATQNLDYRSIRSRTPSASQIVHEALNDNGLRDLSLGNVQKIWSEKRDSYRDFWAAYQTTEFDDLEEVERV
jgi:hypothetical protein